jgi:putative (di)nucleoside polyphosphate hydrolase
VANAARRHGCEGEEPLQTAMRELKEEIGTNKASVIAQSRTWLRYDLPSDLIPKVLGGKYRGQEQQWFLMRFDGTDADINLLTPEPEFQAWRWASLEELPELIVPFKRDLYLQIIEEFRPYLEKSKIID